MGQLFKRATSHLGPFLQMEGAVKLEPVHLASSPSSASCLVSAGDSLTFLSPTFSLRQKELVSEETMGGRSSAPVIPSLL